ncbi:MAG: nucleotidyl transferase AbiEii/AbiGii toxin family protein [Candidatus Melainabacteria bacterium]|nr:nucleotidyl transferase AbiEii/AbiGii toxin family protein [Candidatus Melainabacteria bacterium]
MLEIIENKIKKTKSREEKINILREFLQILTLKILRDKNTFLNIAFIGGTCLRILYDLKRYSEDLDFSLISNKGYNFLTLLENLKKEFNLYNIQTDFKYTTGTVNNCFIKFKGVLQDFDLHHHRDEKLSIKLEIDTNPPSGANLEEKIVNNQFIFNLIVYDLPSLMAGKLHAVMCRKYTKGRDFYDLLWYLTKKTIPNIKLLNNSIIQTEKEDWAITEVNWKEILSGKLKKLNYKKIRNDASPFLQTKEEADLITFSSFESLIK